MESLEKRIASIPEVEPDEVDLLMLKQIEEDLDCKEMGANWEDYKKQLARSGKLSLRLPKELHWEIAEAAEEEDTSINQIIVYLLSKAMGERKALLHK